MMQPGDGQHAAADHPRHHHLADPGGQSLGIYSAVSQYSVGDYLFTSLSFLGISMPPFWFGLLAIEFLAFKPKQWFGLTNTPLDFVGLHSPGQNGVNVDYLQHLVLPVLTLTVQIIAEWSRYQRAVDARRHVARLRAHGQGQGRAPAAA